MKSFSLFMSAARRQVRFILWALASLAMLSGGVSRAREFEVKLLNGTEQNGAWGTKEFQMDTGRGLHAY